MPTPVLAAPSDTWTFFDNDWHPGNVGILGPRSHAAWLGTTVFDGARAFEGVTPDLRGHCERINRSASAFHLEPSVSVEKWMSLAIDGLRRFDRDAELYVRPMYWPELGAEGGGIRFEPTSTRWCLCLYEAPMPAAEGGAITLSPYRRPSIECAPVDAKASCLYPNSARALFEARDRGFDNCLMRDLHGDIAELANANVFLVKDGRVSTPRPCGAFLDGITRQRVIALLRAVGVEVSETTLSWEDFLAADEIFSTGNFAKLRQFTRIANRELSIGPIGTRARRLYWEFAHSAGTGA